MLEYFRWELLVIFARVSLLSPAQWNNIWDESLYWSTSPKQHSSKFTQRKRYTAEIWHARRLLNILCHAHKACQCKVPKILMCRAFSPHLSNPGSWFLLKFCSITIIIFHIPYTELIGPGVLACATRGGGRSEAGNCFHLLFSSFFFFSFPTLSAFDPLRGNSCVWDFVSPDILA